VTRTRLDRAYRRTAALCALATVAALVTGCATGNGSGSTTTEPTTAAAGPTTAPTVSTVESSAASLVGRWAHFDVVAYEGAAMKTLIVSYGFNDIAEVDGRLVDTASFCFAEQVTDQPIETSLSDAATQAIVPPPTPLMVDLVDGRVRLRRPPSPTPIGIELDDPAVDPLPDDPADARLVDADRDGKPGITVTITVGGGLTGELYLARREIFSWEAFLVGTDSIEGVVTDSSEQLVLGASDPIFLGAGADWVQVADLTRSPLVLRRVDPSWDCARLALERSALLPAAPSIDW
jgi:hypothetical protein